MRLEPIPLFCLSVEKHCAKYAIRLLRQVWVRHTIIGAELDNGPSRVWLTHNPLSSNDFVLDPERVAKSSLCWHRFLRGAFIRQLLSNIGVITSSVLAMYIALLSFYSVNVEVLTPPHLQRLQRAALAGRRVALVVNKRLHAATGQHGKRTGCPRRELRRRRNSETDAGRDERYRSVLSGGDHVVYHVDLLGAVHAERDFLRLAALQGRPHFALSPPSRHVELHLVTELHLIHVQ
jgi:hypothetical protein